MEEEKAFWQAIVSAPLDRLPRLVFCDWLDERNDPRAAGMRVLAEYDRYPWWEKRHDAEGWDWYVHTIRAGSTLASKLADNHGADRSHLPEVWCQKAEWLEPEESEQGGYHPDIRSAMDAATQAWLDLTDDEKADCLLDLDRITNRLDQKAEFPVRTETTP